MKWLHCRMRSCLPRPPLPGELAGPVHAASAPAPATAPAVRRKSLREIPPLPIVSTPFVADGSDGNEVLQGHSIPPAGVSKTVLLALEGRPMAAPPPPPLATQRQLFEIPDEVAYFNCASLAPLPRAARLAGEAALPRPPPAWPG